MVSLVGYWKSLIILKGIKKQRQIFRVWVKNQLRFEIFWENFKIYIWKSQEKLIFNHFLSDVPGILSFYTALENKTIFYNNFFGFGEGKLNPPLRAPLLWKPFSLRHSHFKCKLKSIIPMIKFALVPRTEKINK